MSKKNQEPRLGKRTYPRERKAGKSAPVVDTKMAAANDTTNAPVFVERLSPEQIMTNDEKATPAPAAPVSARTAAIRRSQAGKFNKVVLTQIGGAEAPKFYPWTWEQRDKFMSQDTPEAKAVKARYDAHMASVKA